MGQFLFSLQKQMSIDTCQDQVEMADYVVVFVLDKITNLLAEEAILLQGVKHDIQYIKDELERMIAFLGVADAFEDGDAEVKVWVRQVRDVAHDIEDVLDESIVLSYDHHFHGSCCFIAKLVFSIRNIKSRHKLVFETQSIRSRVCNIAEGHQRYRYKFYVPEQGSSNNHACDTANDRRGDALLLEEAELVGIENPRQQLIGWLMEDDPRLKVVSVVGMGGSGKTTLVKKVYEDAAVKKNFNSLAWITVSQSFKVEEVLKDMIQQLYDEVKQPAPEGLSTMNSNRLKAIAKVFLQSRMYLLVFDDIWTIQAWDAIRYALPDVNNGSRVILTTRLFNVASFSSIETNGYVYELKALSAEESWILFCQKAFHGNSCPSNLENISRNILKKCGGLPLAIVAVGGVLATKNRTNIREWGMLNHSLGPELDSNDKFDSMRIILLLSFNDLPYYLKPCFLYLSIYPEDHLIERNTLIYRWITEGFVKRKEGRTVEDVAESYLNELINRSLMHPVEYNDDGSLKLGRIHDLYRELILSKSRDDNFTTTTDEQNILWPEKTRRLSIHGTLGNLQVKRWTRLTEDPLKYLQDLPNLVHLEFLVGYTGEELYFEQGKFQRLKLLNLDKLEGLRRVTIGEGAIPHLEKLVIQRCALLESVPTGIKCLLNLTVLEFFDMPDEFIMTLHPDKLGADSWKVSHIPEVYYTYWRDGCWMVHSLKEKCNSQISGHYGAVTRTYGRRNSL
ncbi:disease resistance protein RPM1-like isoform X2 [Lycium ferocissimum]|uniref:disease resistance protein RPM1-like isoform X2 n=1 Tax=Lycium ferocissimum TaxID=112874 RepID=UPI002815F49C|nr:disease resistance protein RPM1-like isoform X2 [Lycium ferocissimum]